MLETTVSSLPGAKKCGLCYEWFEAEQMRWDAEPYCYVCKDDEACTARRPGARGRKRAVLRLDRYHFSGQSNTLMAHQPKQSKSGIDRYSIPLWPGGGNGA